MASTWLPGPALAGSLLAECPVPCVLFEPLRDAAGARLDYQWTALNPAAEGLVRSLRLERVLSRWQDVLEGVPAGEALDRVVAEDAPLTFELSCREGFAECWFRTQAVKHEQGFALWLFDISDTRLERRRLREAEERYRLASWATNDVLWDWKPETDEVHWGEASQAVFGYAPEEMGTLEWWSAQIHPEDRELVLRGLHHAVEAGGESWSSEYRFRRKDGTYAYVLDRGLVSRDARGRAVRMIGSMMDITERKRAEERLREEALFRERFIGILGHDLRNPLNAITLSARALRRRGSLSLAQQQHAQRIEGSAERMGNMISDILDLTRARLSGGIPLQLAPTKLPAVCRQVVEELSVVYPDRHIVYAPEGEGEGIWDPDRLAQVVSNLVANALEHGDKDSIVTVRSRSEPEGEVLEVSNAGPPIPDYLLDTLFDPFRQVRGPRRGRGSGLGLGLFIVREIVEAHGGEVGVHSTEGDGTSFTVRLPRDARSFARQDAQDAVHSS